MEEGYAQGEICNRGGCIGVLREHDSDGCCSCHINPPCSHCTENREYCPECGWEASDDQAEYDKAQSDYWKSEAGLKQIARYQKQQEESDRRRSEFWSKFRSAEPVSELIYIKESHTHFSMKVTGIYPVGDTSGLMEKIRGTFGGRFESNNPKTGRFVYIAYTD